MIRTFEDIRAAYSGSCCYCNKPIQQTLEYQYNWEEFKPKFITLDLPDNDIIKFNQDTGTVIEFTITETISSQGYMTFGFKQQQQFWNTPQIKYTIFDGVFMVGHTVTCSNCSMYSYTLQLFINLNDRKIYKAVLNSESITMESGADNYEIRNVYTTGKTEYNHISPQSKTKTLVLPLISDSMENPQEVLNRIKKLLVFS